MNEEYSFIKQCWVCLAEKRNMSSLFDNEKITDRIDSSVSLYDLLHHIVQSEIFFINGPHLICNKCKEEALAAYKFKKRCEFSLNILRKYNLKACKGESLEKMYNLNDPQSATQIEDNTFELSDINMLEQDGNDSVLDEIKVEDCIESANSENCVNTLASELKNNVQVDLCTKGDKNLPQLLTAVKLKTDLLLCTICGLERSRYGMRKHLLVHKNLKSYACPHCPQKYSDKSNLRVHVRIHTESYICDICGKKFKQATEFKIHKRIHEDSKPYKCHMCSYSGRTHFMLKLHIKRHTGLKNKDFKQCNYSTCTSSELKYRSFHGHLKNIHEKVYA